MNDRHKNQQRTYLSGAQKRRESEKKEKSHQEVLAKTAKLDKFFPVVTLSVKKNESHSLSLEEIEDRTNVADDEIFEVNNNVNDETEAEKEKDEEDQESKFDSEMSTAKDKFLFSNDASTWPVPMPDSIRLEIIQIGSAPFQNKDGPFLPAGRTGESTKGSNRSMKSSWFYSCLPDGTKFLRKWMLYSLSTNKLYCFCCRIFATEEDLPKKFVSGLDH